LTVPPGGGTLSYWYSPPTINSITVDQQASYVHHTSATTLATIMHIASNTQTWTNVTFNMAPYAGTTLGIKFLAHGDNAGDPTDMFVDDVTLFAPGACGGTSTATATVTPTSTATVCVGGVSGTPGPWTTVAPYPVTGESPAV